MIGELQGDFGDLDNKYLKQNVSGCRSEISGSFKRTLQLCMSNQVGATGGSGYVYPDKLKRPPPPSGHKISGCKMSVHGIPGYEMSPRRQSVRINSIQIPPRGHVPQCYPDSLRGKCGAMLSGAAPSGRQHILSGYIVRMENID